MPADAARRLAAPQKLAILDTPEEYRFDRARQLVVASIVEVRRRYPGN